MTADDVFQALNELGFDKYSEPLKDFMKNYTEKEDQVQKTLYKKRKMPGGDVAEDDDRPTVSFKKLRENPDAVMAEDDYKVVDINQALSK